MYDSHPFYEKLTIEEGDYDLQQVDASGNPKKLFRLVYTQQS